MFINERGVERLNVFFASCRPLQSCRIQGSPVFDRLEVKENREEAAVPSNCLTNITCRKSETSSSADRLPVSLLAGPLR